MDTKTTNDRFNKIINEYKSDIKKTNEILIRNKTNEPINKEDIDWLCNSLIYRISQVESSLYDH